MGKGEKLLQIVFIGLEGVDMIGDVTYLLYFPHCSLWVIWILSYSLFMPFAFTCIITLKSRETNEGRDRGILYAVAMYFGLTIIFSENHDQNQRLAVVGFIAVGENLL